MNVPYITLLNLAERPGLIELSQIVAQDGEIPVSSDLLSAIIHKQDTSSWSTDDVAAAHATISRITESINDSEAEINGFLRQRGHKLPLTVVPRLLTDWARIIVRYKLHRNRVSDEKSDPIVRDYKQVLGFLKMVAEGKYSLGIDDALPVAGGVPKQTGPVRVFDMNTLRDFGR
ncbi:DUF1320 domain-containing protein [Gilliamella sp. B2840]|uniref:gp436 family protein n=1 Tax=unclassified Gilliamella TaxID=2685620 RepID=UPI00226AAFAA|nr:MULTISPECIES: DUF1320 domain-containing protein [unclassified Gilliamella]MCX8696247.1 DUF1320 domain-containing protein [Gilliamella sp. B2828]MCX8701600.1 DUF1320 domain-containing protein [Gilliamella sp. B2840]